MRYTDIICSVTGRAFRTWHALYCRFFRVSRLICDKIHLFLLSETYLRPIKSVFLCA